MRPLKLTMSAFGPYADKTVIDFRTLGTLGVYLVMSVKERSMSLAAISAPR